jgi:hypothetical protein
MEKYHGCQFHFGNIPSSFLMVYNWCVSNRPNGDSKFTSQKIEGDS